MTGWPATRRRVLGALATGLAAGVVGVAVVVHVGRATRVTSWAAAFDVVAVVDLVAALALVAAGGLTLLMSSAPGGAVCLLLAVGWVSPVLVGWEGGDPALRAVATIGPALVVPSLQCWNKCNKNTDKDSGYHPFVSSGFFGWTFQNHILLCSLFSRVFFTLISQINLPGS
jgi:hypothetical protein